jgi:type II secretory pathway component PulM
MPGMNTNKKILMVLVVVLVLVAGYFVIKQPTQTGQVPTDATSQGKLNINAICENALTYMTFENQAAADQFVAECKEGKHPEVIEQYNAQMNLGNGAAI